MTTSSNPPAATLHGLVETSAERFPDVTALVCGTHRITYAELDALANRVASHLRDIGVGGGDVVALVATRSVWTVVSQLAVLKAGAAFVPVDPKDAPLRRRAVVEESGAGVVVCARADLAVVEALAAPGRHAMPVVVPDFDSDWLATLPSGPVDVAVDARDLAYVIFTSGSTGRPKGVMVEHASIVASTLAQRREDRPDPGVFLLMPPLYFDASLDGLYWSLSSGGTVVIPEDGRHRDPLHLRELVRTHRVTHSDCTPTLYRLVLGDDADGLESLQCVKVGGEACPSELVRRHAQLLPDTVLVNNYGPTETTVWATCWTYRPGEPVPERIPIGRPIDGVAVRVLDDAMQPVADGRPGELFIAGAGVARGYVGHPELTAERFPADLWGTPGSRMYRTGDLVALQPDGNLQFLGRCDEQVKLNGYRIEPTEVAEALQSHPWVQQAVVAVREIVPGRPELVGYVVGSGTGSQLEPDVPERLRAHLADRVPTHMLPRKVVVLEQLPMTANGKVDTSALPLPPDEPAAQDEPPATETERQVAGLAAQMLGTGPIGRNSHLLDLGMTSVHIAALSMSLWQQRGISIGVHALFENPTVAAIADLVDGLGRSDEIALGHSLEELKAFSQLPVDVQPLGDGDTTRWTRPQAVLVTGGTGYLGSFLVGQLLADTDADVICLVRAHDDVKAERRLRDTLRGWGLHEAADDPRLRAVAGDLAEPRLGLGLAVYERLTVEVDAIYHSGALVNFLYPYSRLKAANVDGTVELLRLASTHHDKAFHYVSSVDNLLTTGMERPFLEDVPIDATEVPVGYPLTKLVSELLVHEALRRGLPGTVHRAGMVMGHTVTGACAADYLIIQVTTLVEFGVAATTDALLDAIPVDFAAEAIVRASGSPSSSGRTYHLWSGHPVHYDQVLDWARSYGYRLDPVSEEHVVGLFQQLPPTHPLFPLLPLFSDPNWRDVRRAFKPAFAHTMDPAQERRNLLEVLGEDGDCGAMTQERAHRMFAFLVERGLMESPASQNRRLREADAADVAGVVVATTMPQVVGAP